MTWVKYYDEDYVNLNKATHIYIFDNGVDYSERWSVNLVIEGDNFTLLKCQEERTARHYVGRLMKKIGTV